MYIGIAGVATGTGAPGELAARRASSAGPVQPLAARAAARRCRRSPARWPPPRVARRGRPASCRCRCCGRLVAHADVLRPTGVRRASGARRTAGRRTPHSDPRTGASHRVGGFRRARRDDRVAARIAQQLGPRRLRGHTRKPRRALRLQPRQQRRHQQVALQVVGRDGDGAFQRAGSKPAAWLKRAARRAVRGRAAPARRSARWRRCRGPPSARRARRR